jgi:hypothetical protein
MEDRCSRPTGVGLHLATVTRRMVTPTLAELLDRKVEFACADAVAIVQLLASGPNIADARAPYGPPSLENIAVCGDGSIRCLHTAATPSIVEAALLLESLVNRAHDRVPGGLRYAIGRGLHEVEAPPFDTLADFSAALSRFERGARSDRIRQLFKAVSSGETSAADAPIVPQGDRRRHEPTAAELRRQLREADLRLYEARRVARASQEPRRARRIRRGPIAACMAAGIALVAVGEFTPAGRVRVSPTAPTSAGQSDLPAPSAASQPASRSESTVASAGAHHIAAAAPVVPDSHRTRPSASVGSTPLTTRSGRTRARTSAQPVSASARAKNNRRTSRETDRDRGVIARIRFEWNDPFHR